MVNVQLAHYIEHEQKQGYTRKQIRNVLKRYGYSDSTIDEGFHYLEKDVEQKAAMTDITGKEPDEIGEAIRKAEAYVPNRNISTIVAAIFLIIVGAFILMALAF